MNRKCVVVIVGVFLLGGLGCKKSKTELTLKNESTHTITKLAVTLGKDTEIAENILPKTEVNFIFVIPGDSSYKVRAEFEGGKVNEKEVGYLTSGIESKDILIIDENDLRLKQTTIEVESADIKNGPK